MNYYMGIDVGTYETKGVLIDQGFQVIARKAVRHGLENPQPGFFEHDAEKVWWGDLCQVSKELIAESGVDPADIKCLGTSALGADCLVVDADCKPVRKAILYGIDSRAIEEIEQLNESYGEEKIHEIWGRPLCSSDVAPKILWIKNHEPEAYAKTAKFLTATSYLTAKLTGNYVIDKFLVNTFAPCYDKAGRIDPKAAEPFCRADQLAECRNTTDIVGTITAQAAQATGLAIGTPVLTGTDDSGAEAISTGVFKPGDMMVQLGSSCYFIYCSDELVKDERLWHDSFIIPNTFSISGGTNTAGTLTRWFRDTLFFDKVAEEETTGVKAYQAMLEGVESVPPGSDGLVILPYFAGERTPINDSQAKGLVFGLRLDHTRAQLYKAALEGVAYSIAQHFDIIESLGKPLEKIMVVGGGTQNPLWLQIIADVSGRPVHVARETIGAAYGDALMAGLAGGEIDSLGALDGFIKPEKTFMPDPGKTKIYKQFRQIFEALYLQNKELMHLL